MRATWGYQMENVTGDKKPTIVDAMASPQPMHIE